MKQKDLIRLAGLCLITALVAYFISGLVFKVPATRSAQIPVASNIDTTFPDITNDPTYNTIFNKNSIDLAVPLDTSTGNSQPFNGSLQPTGQ